MHVNSSRDLLGEMKRIINLITRIKRSCEVDRWTDIFLWRHKKEQNERVDADVTLNELESCRRGLGKISKPFYGTSKFLSSFAQYEKIEAASR